MRRGQKISKFIFASSLVVLLPLSGCFSPRVRPPLVPYRGPVEEISVVPGDTVYGIGRRYAASVEILAELNQLEDPDALHVGQRLKVPARDQGRARFAGSTPPPPAAERVAKSNEASPSLQSSAGALKKVRLSAARRHIGRLRFPVTPGRVTSEFGWRWLSFHEGIDIAAPEGRPIVAAHDGVVVYSGDHIRGYGNIVLIKTTDLLTVYGHNRKNLVRVGQKVAAGQVIAELGQSGKASGPHCHFETRIRDEQGKFAAVDPAVFWSK